MEKKKSIYIQPETEIVQLSLFTPIAGPRDPGGGGGGGWEEFPASYQGPQYGREGRFFLDDEEEEETEEKLLNFSPWD